MIKFDVENKSSIFSRKSYLYLLQELICSIIESPLTPKGADFYKKLKSLLENQHFMQIEGY